MEKVTSLSDILFKEIETDILGGKYQPGEILSENKLAQKYGVSRTPIRDAVNKLKQEHLIEYENSKVLRVVGISKEDIQDIYAIRLQIEPEGIKRLLDNIDEDFLAELKDILDLQYFYVSKQDAENIRLTDTNFHEKLYEQIGSPVYKDVLIDLHKKIMKVRKNSVSNSSRAILAYQEHMEIFEALKKGDSVKLEEVVRNHIINARNSILSTF